VFWWQEKFKLKKVGFGNESAFGNLFAWAISLVK
jgi:hypothetical protein